MSAELKALFKEVKNYTVNSMSQSQKRLHQGKAFGHKNKLKLPFKMYQGMQKKSLERMNQQKESDRKAGIIGDSSREKKVMQTFFEKKAAQKVEDKKLNLDKERGMNMYVNSIAKYKDGALNISKFGLKKMERGQLGKDQRSKGIKKKERLSYEDIMARRQDNPEYMTGKRFKKKKGSAKKFGSGGKKKFKKGKKH